MEPLKPLVLRVRRAVITAFNEEEVRIMITDGRRAIAAELDMAELEELTLWMVSALISHLEHHLEMLELELEHLRKRSAPEETLRRLEHEIEHHLEMLEKLRDVVRARARS